MRNAIAIEQFERRLIELGCPGRRLRASVQELGDHCQDLHAAALAEGCSESDAAARATVQLGHPVVLAENLVLGLRQASWWGRHPIIGLCLCPVVALILIWIACVSGLIGVCWFWGWLLGPAYRFDHSALAAFQSNTVAFDGLAGVFVQSIGTISDLMLTVCFCWLAWRASLGWKWTVAACAACGLACLIFFVSLKPHNLTIGLYLSSAMNWRGLHWLLALIPLAAAVLVYWRQRTRENQLPPISRALRGVVFARPAFGQRLWASFGVPTYWITMILLGLLLWAIVPQVAGLWRSKARQTQLKSHIWPAERAATFAQLKSRQQLAAGVREATINLQPWVNAALTTDSGTDNPNQAKGNNLASLPTGVQVFGGVPFDVSGRIQLCGQDQASPGKRFPACARNIAIDRRCDRLQLLHGAGDVSGRGQPVARLVLHYADGSVAKIPIIAGEHVLDWWGPVYTTDSGDDRFTTSPGTELAWAGSNPAIQEHEPDFSLRLYRSTFANPHPELEIKTIDYVSSLTQAAPFLVGLTLETATP